MDAAKSVAPFNLIVIQIMNNKHNKSVYIYASILLMAASIFSIFLATKAVFSQKLEISLTRAPSKVLFIGHEVFVPSLGLYLLGISLLIFSITGLINRGPVKSQTLINILGATSLLSLALLFISAFLKINV